MGKNKIKRERGRPIKWTEELLEKEADLLLDWFQDKKNFWLTDFAHSRGYSRCNLSELSKKSEYFANALKIAKEIQESRIAKGGLTGKFNSSMTIFALKNVAKWRDKIEEKETTPELLQKYSEMIEGLKKNDEL